MKLACLMMAVAAAFVAQAETNVVPSPAKVVEKPGTCRVSMRGGKPDFAGRVNYQTDKAIPKEGYRIAIAESGVKVVSSDAAGRFYALETLKQLADATSASLPCCKSSDHAPLVVTLRK